MERITLHSLLGASESSAAADTREEADRQGAGQGRQQRTQRDVSEPNFGGVRTRADYVLFMAFRRVISEPTLTRESPRGAWQLA